LGPTTTRSRLWVRIISVHYAAIARHWKQEGLDLLGDYAEKLTPQFRQMLIDGESISAVDHALDDVLRTGVFVGLQSVFERYDFIVSPTLAVPPFRNAANGNTLGPTEIAGKSVEPLIGWCMTNRRKPGSRIIRGGLPRRVRIRPCACGQ